MKEHIPDGGDAIQKLSGLLGSDFTPASKRDAPAPPADDALASFLSKVTPSEGIDRRFESPENAQLGQDVLDLLAPAPVTESFRRFIADRVRAAHAWQAPVDEAVAPDRLGLTRGLGIFDPNLAEGLEAEALRGRFFDVVHRYTVTVADPESEGLPSLMLRPDVRPKDFREAVDTLDRWGEDFQHTYGEDPLAGMEPEAYRAAAPEAKVTSGDEVQELGLTTLGEELRRLRDEG